MTTNTKRLLGVAVAIYISLALPAAPVFSEDICDVLGLPIVASSISISDAVNAALANNPSIASRRAIVAAANARIQMAKSMTGLQVATTTSASASNVPMVFSSPGSVQPQNYSLTGDKPRLNQNIMAMYPLYTGGNLKGRVADAKALEQAASWDVAATELDTALAVKTAYYQALLAGKYVEAYQKRVDEAKERLRIADEAFAAGRIARYDLLRNQTDLAEAQQQLNNSQRDTSTALIDLKSMMAVSQSSQLTLSQELTLQSTAPTISQLQAAAIAQRPELNAVRLRILAAKENVGVTKSAYKPQVYATAMADLSVSQHNSMNEDSTSTGYLIGFAASLPLLDGGLRRSSVKEAQAALSQMQADEQQSLLNVSREVATSVTQYESATKNVGLAQASITQAEEDYSVIKMRYEAGKATNVEVLDALASLTRSQTMYAEALYNQNVAFEAMNRAIGKH